MAQSVRDALSKIFYPTQERLETLMQISKTNKKKKVLYLALTVTISKPPNVQIYLVKRSDKGEWKPKVVCNTRHLRQVDCHDTPAQPSYDFELRCDGKTTRVFAMRLKEKLDFVETMCRVLRVHQPVVFRSIVFLNLPEGLNTDQHTTFEEHEGLGAPSVDGETASAGGEPEDLYQSLTPREERDIKVFLSESQDALVDAAAFMEKLKRHLVDTEGTNIHSIMSSEEQVLKLMSTIDVALDQVDTLQTKLDFYDAFFAEVEEAMSRMTDRDKLLQMTNENRAALLSSLEMLHDGLTLDTDQMRALLEVDLKTPGGIERCAQAANKLDTLIRRDMPKGLEHMKAVEDKKQEFRRIRDTFAHKFCTHMNDMFVRHANDLIAAVSSGERDMSKKHAKKHLEMMQLAPFMLWLKQNKTESYEELKRLYCLRMNAVYEREVREFIDAAKNRLCPSKDKRQAALKGAGSNTSLSKIGERTRTGSRTAGDELTVPAMVSGTGHKFEIVFEDVLTTLKPLVIAEQEFCTSFFHMISHDDPGESRDGPDTASVGYTSPADSDICPYMVGLFGFLQKLLLDLVNFCEQLNSAYSLYMLVLINKHFDKHTRDFIFHSRLFFEVIIGIKHVFDLHIDTFIQSFKDFRPNKKARCGLIPFVKDYEQFAESSASIFHESNRLSDLERAHSKVVYALITEIDRIASEHGKTPREVIIMENYHRLDDILRRLKMNSLDVVSQDIRKRYTEALEEYVTNSMGRPLDKLYSFFKNVQECIANGIKEEAIAYQFVFSKQELRKVIKEYPGKEVKKGLEHLCKKVEKHLCEEENLFQVVWRSIQAEFIKQCAYYQDLIKKCYPDSGITLDFSTSDLEEYFSEIARSR